MGIMGQGVSQFRPFDVVTRADFGTILSRVLRGDKHNEDGPYYITHLNALKNVGIMNDITDVNEVLTRGEVFLILERAHTIPSSNNICENITVKLDCSLGHNNCPTQCITL